MFTSRQAVGRGAGKRWMPITVIGLIAVIAGIAFPQTLPSAPEAAKSNTGTATSESNKLVYAPPSMPEPPDAKSLLTRLGLATIAVMALCGGTLWLGRRWLGAAPPAGTSTNHLRLMETLALGNRCALHLVHVGNRQVLIGADSSGLKTIVPLQESFEQELSEASV